MLYKSVIEASIATLIMLSTEIKFYSLKWLFCFALINAALVALRKTSEYFEQQKNTELMQHVYKYMRSLEK